MEHLPTAHNHCHKIWRGPWRSRGLPGAMGCFWAQHKPALDSGLPGTGPPRGRGARFLLGPFLRGREGVKQRRAAVGMEVGRTGVGEGGVSRNRLWRPGLQGFPMQSPFLPGSAVLAAWYDCAEKQAHSQVSLKPFKYRRSLQKIGLLVLRVPPDWKVSCGCQSLLLQQLQPPAGSLSSQTPLCGERIRDQLPPSQAWLHHVPAVMAPASSAGSPSR